MQEIIQSIVAKTGISQAQAEAALEVALSSVKTKLPDSVASQLDGLMAGKEFDFKAVLSDKIGDLRDDAAAKLEDLKEGAADKFEDIKEGLKRMF